MSRSRNIKPGFFKNELLVELPFEHRILFIGLWTLADRSGRMEDRPVRIKMEIFPADNVDVNAGLQALHNSGFILRYESNGCKYIQVLAWDKHQNPHIKEAPSTIPAPCLHSARTVQDTTKVVASPADSGFLIPDSLIPEKSLSPANAVDAGIADSSHLSPKKLNGHKRELVPIEQIVALYHESLPLLPRVEKITKARQGYIRQRWIEDLPTIEAWRNYFADVGKSRFLTGRSPGSDGKPPFRADLEWLCRPGNFAKVSEGKYHA